MSKIRSRVFEYGDKNESDWPPRFGSGKRGSFYIDRDTGKLKHGRPPPREVYDIAPAVIPDTLPGEFYHHGACKKTNSRSEINRMDRETGCLTTGGRQPPDPSEHNRRIAERKRDSREALNKAVAAIDSGNAPLTEEQRAACDLRNETVSAALNFDAFNVVGRKDNAKGKRFKRFRR